MKNTPHILVNGLCVPPGGVFTVARELVLSLATQRPDWRFSLVLSEGRPVHQEFKQVAFPKNTSLVWTPAITANHAGRLLYENTMLTRWSKRNGVTAAMQLNGMMIPALDVPTFSHAGDPWPYRHDLWSHDPYESAVMAVKRHEYARALRHAPFVGWTSSYLRDLACDYHGMDAKQSEVLHNGLPEAYRHRAAGQLPDWSSRPLEILTVSNVVSYKRQELVIRSLARLVRRSGLESARYRMLGAVEPKYRRTLETLAARLGVADRIIIEGRVPQERIEHCLAEARVFAFMSVCECFGIPPVEAMSFGTPVITADCCSAREIYGEAAEYSVPDDLEMLTDKLEMLLTDEHRANELRVLGAQRAQLYSWERTGQSIAHHFAGMMGI
jgi:glycosyltransferase involved in cell wall biosynthesis